MHLLFISFVLLSVSCGGGGASSPQEPNPTNANSAPMVSDASASILSTASTGAVIVSITASDSDGDTLSYALSAGNNAGYFGINASTGDILLAATPVPDTYTLVAEVSDGIASSQATVTITVTAVSTTPVVKKPEDVAPAVDSTVIASFASGISFLYDGADAVQFGADAAAMDEQRVIVVRGKVSDGASSPAAPLQNVRVEIKDHAESGYTLTRDDGRFDIAVNGGGDIVLEFSADGYLKAQRKLAATPWNDFVLAPDVVLVALDSKVTTVSFGASASGFQVARGSTTSDNNPERTPTLLIPPGTVATMTLPNGDVEQTQLDLRMTEYTVGDDGPARMVGDLPPVSGYTYAVEISADQALAQDADMVTFNQPVYYYLDNYRGFPVGGIVPTGYYDFGCACWVASENGLVIKIVAINGGLAEVDIDGDDAADSDLLSINMNDAERAQLATLYSSGDEVYRIPLRHLTPYDYNWPYDLPSGADGPDTDPEGDDGDPCKAFGSIVNCTSQTLGERIELPGTGLALHYNSEYVYGFSNNRTIRMPVTGPVPPVTPPDWVDFSVNVAGQQVANLQGSLYLPGETLTATWDGLDAYGRPVQGGRLAAVSYDYVYKTTYTLPASSGPAFGQSGSGLLTVPGSPVPLGNTYLVPLDNFQAKDAAVGLGGWTLDIHHSYDRFNQTVYRGDGGQQSVQYPVINTLPVDPAISLLKMESVVSAPDGSLFFDTDSAVFKRNLDGSIEQIAGVGQLETSGNGGPALEAGMNPQRLYYAPDDSIYFSDYNETDYSSTLRRLYLQNGVYYVEQIASNTYSSTSDSSGDGGPVAAAEFHVFSDFVIGPDSAIYIADYDHVRRIGPDGIVTTFAGGGSSTPDNGLLAVNAGFNQVLSIDFNSQGELYMLIKGNSIASTLVYKVLADGTLSHVAGIENATNTQLENISEGLLASNVWLANMGYIKLAADDSIYLSGSGAGFSDSSGSFRMHVVRHISTDGYITNFAGTYTKFSNDGDGEAAYGAGLAQPRKVALIPDGRVVIPTFNAIRFVEASAAVVMEGDEHYHVASNTAPEVFVFDPDGRHIVTRHALTGAELYRFGYDSSGLLSSITLGSGGTIQLQRNGGYSLNIVGVGGHTSQLSMNGDGYLQTLTLPGLQQYSFSYLGGGLLQSASFPDGVVSNFEYDSTGRLLRDSNSEGLDLQLTRNELANGFEVIKSYYDGGALGKQETYRSEVRGEQLVSTYISSTGGSNQTTFDPNGRTTITYADGSVTTMKMVADPRWGMMAPNLGYLQIEQPSGLTRTLTETISVDVDPADIYALNSQTISKSINSGSNSTEQYLRQTNGVDVVHQVIYTSPLGRVITTTINDQGRDLRTAQSGLDDRVYSYNALGQLASATFGSESYSYSYDGITRLLSSSTDIDNLSTIYSFDANAFSSRIEPPSGNGVDMSHDAAGRLTQLVSAKGTTYAHNLSWRYDGGLASYTPPAGVTTRRSYSADGRITGSDVDASDPLTQSYRYNTAYQLTSIDDDFGGATFSYTAQSKQYDVASYLQLDANALDQSTNYDYDGSLLTLVTIDNTGSGNDVINYEYDSRFRPSLIRFNPDSDNIALSLGWNDDDLLTQYGVFSMTRNANTALVESMDDGTATFSTGHNTRGYLSSQSLAISSADSITLSLGYHNNGELASTTLGIGTSSSEKHYVYDNDRQIAQVKASASATDNLEQYVYDANGNITSFSYSDGSIHSHTQSFNERDQVTARDGIAYSYDNRGSLSTRGSDSFVYDTQGRLLSATIGATTIRYGYDALGRRTSRSDASGNTEYFYGVPGNAQLISHLREADGTLVVLYYDSNARLIAFDRIASSSERFYVTSDYNGSPLIITDAAGNVVIQREFTAYGIRFNETNTAGFDSPLGFAGGLEDSVTGLVRFGMRDYEPLSAHWTARDPILFQAGQANIYAYAQNNPVNNRDLSGLLCVGASFYEIVGGGADLCIDETGVSVCGKAGVGVGGGVSFSPTGSTSNTGNSLSWSGGAGIGPLNAGGGFEIGPEGVSCSLNFDTFSPDIGLHAGAELAAKGCVKF